VNTDEWSVFADAMETNFSILAKTSTPNPTGFDLVTFSPKGAKNVSMQTCLVKVFKPSAEKNEESYEYLVPGVQVTPHAIAYLDRSPKLGEIASKGHVINLPNTTYKQL